MEPKIEEKAKILSVIKDMGLLGALVVYAIMYLYPTYGIWDRQLARDISAQAHNEKMQENFNATLKLTKDQYDAKAEIEKAEHAKDREVLLVLVNELKTLNATNRKLLSGQDDTKKVLQEIKKGDQ